MDLGKLFRMGKSAEIARTVGAPLKKVDTLKTSKFLELDAAVKGGLDNLSDEELEALGTKWKIASPNRKALVRGLALAHDVYQTSARKSEAIGGKA